MLETIWNTLVQTEEALTHEPSLWMCITLLAYAFGIWVYKKSGYKTIFTPLIVAIAIVISIIILSGSSYEDYFEGGQHINFLLGPATVALAIPLYEQRLRLAKIWIPLSCGLIAGSIVAIISAVGIAYVLNASPTTILSLAPKSVTVPIAIGISQNIGGVAELTAALVVITGAVGSMLAKPLFTLMRDNDDITRGAALGLAAHGLGTATGFQMSREIGAFAALSMGLTGLLTAFLAPIIVPSLMSLLETYLH